MNIDRITIRRLKTHGNYENVSVELSRPVKDGEAWEQALAELDDMVTLKLAQLIERDRQVEQEFHRSEEVKRLQATAEDLRREIDAISQWLSEHRDFVRVYESITGKDVEIPF